MWKYTVEVGGMMCGMCESHINDAVRRSFDVKKVSSSRSKKQTVIQCENELDEDALRKAISDTGYEVGSIKKEKAEKRKLFGM
jgi:copper chaperone CopZ